MLLSNYFNPEMYSFGKLLLYGFFSFSLCNNIFFFLVLLNLDEESFEDQESELKLENQDILK